MQSIIGQIAAIKTAWNVVNDEKADDAAVEKYGAIGLAEEDRLLRLLDGQDEKLCEDEQLAIDDPLLDDDDPPDFADPFKARLFQLRQRLR